MIPYADLHELEEDDRIAAIGYATMDGAATSSDKPRLIAFIVDDNAKADRYIAKLQTRFPGIRVIDRMDGPVNGLSVTVRVGPPLR